MGVKREAGRVRRRWEQQVGPALTTARLLDDHYTRSERRAESAPLPEGAVSAQKAIDGWRKFGKATYLVDPDLADELAATDLPEGSTPYSVFAHRPHVAPLFVLAEPLSGLVPHESGHFQVTYSGFITVPHKVNVEVPGRDPLVYAALSVVWFGRADNGGTISATVEIPTSGLATLNGTDAISDANGVYLQRLHQQALDTEVDESGSFEHWSGMSELLRLSINLILYTSAVNADLAPIAEPRVGGKSVAPRHAPDIHTLGFRVGAALRAARSTSGTTSAPTGRTVTPHLRRAHWHRYWTGPRTGERKVVVRWVSQTFVNTGESDYTPAIRPVHQQAS